MNKTLQHYENNANMLVNKYDNANMDKLHSLFNKHIKKDDVVLDIGFGSGRDLNFIKQNITSNIFGLDGSKEFVNNLKKDNFYQDRVFLSILPNIDIINFEVEKYDVIISIAVLMHLTLREIEQTIQNMKSILNQNGLIIISYSTKSRDTDDRVFYEISKEEMTKLFIQNSFKEIDCMVNRDNLGRNIEWITQVYELKE